MIAKHIRPVDRKTGLKKTGPTDRAAMLRLAKYILRLGNIVLNDFASDAPSEICDQVEDLMRGAKTKCRGRHQLLSWPAQDNDKMTPERKIEAVQRFKKKWGVTHVLACEHDDKDHGHLHMYAFELGKDLKPLRYPNIAWGLRQVAMGMEDDWDLTRTGRGGGDDGGGGGLNISKDTLEMADRQHRQGQRRSPAPDKLVLRARVQRLVQTSVSMSDLLDSAAGQGIMVKVTDYPNGKGVSFSDGVVSMRGKDAGWSYGQLVKHYGADKGVDGANGIIGRAQRAGPAHRRQTGADSPGGTTSPGRPDGSQPAPAKRNPSQGRAGRPQSPLIGLLATGSLSWFMRWFVRICMEADRSPRQHWYDEMRRDRSIDLPGF